jgi:hypothetical protein
MPEKRVIARARKAARQGKAPSVQAGEFVREEIRHVRTGKHGAASAKQAIAIGLSKARRAGVALGAPKPGTTSAATRRKAKQDAARSRRKPARRRSQASLRALERKGRSAATARALSRHAAAAARKRSAAARAAAARKAARTRAKSSR